MSPQTLFLASASPRRAELLTQIGLGFVVVKADILERVAPNESPEQYSRRVAREKAQAGWIALSEQEKQNAVVLGADTEVVLDGRIFGKPESNQHAFEMLECLSRAGWHDVLSSVSVLNHIREKTIIQHSRVRFAALSAEQIEAYVASGEPKGHAGAYAIQGLAAKFITDLSGSFSGVMGLPLFETATLLDEFGIR